MRSYNLNDLPSKYYEKLSLKVEKYVIFFSGAEKNKANLIQCLYTQGLGFPGGSVVNNPPAMQKTQETQIWSLWWEEPLKEGMATQSQYSCLENLMDRGDLWATARHVTKSRTWLKWLNTHTHIPKYLYLEVQMKILSELLYKCQIHQKNQDGDWTLCKCASLSWRERELFIDRKVALSEESLGLQRGDAIPVARKDMHEWPKGGAVHGSR